MSATLKETLATIGPPAERVGEAAQRLLDQKTKPRGSLGRLEELACQIAGLTRCEKPALPRKALVVMAADHGVAQEGTSAYPQAVTGQMLLNFAAGGAAINVLSRQVGAEVVLVDMGVKGPLPACPEILVKRVGPGTQNIALGPAMTRKQATEAVEVGIAVSSELAQRGVGLIGIGDMGIGNTTATSALTCVLCDVSPEECTGRGTGIDDEALRRKIDVIRRALECNAPDPSDPLGVLAKLGGFEIAGLCGVVLGAAAHRVPVVMDGFIASVAALVAVRLSPHVTGALIASHLSVESGHRLVLEALNKRPLFDLGMRLGEGTGAALAMTFVDASLRIVHEMATFDSAAVSDTGA